MTKEFDARNENKSRSVCAAMAEAAGTGKRVLTEREREILDMWPKFEDGEPVMIGDEATNNKNQRFTVKRIEFRHGKWMLNDSVTEGHYLNGKSGKRVKRPAPKALDADGMEIKVGDMIYSIENGNSYTVRSINGIGTIEFKGFNDKGWSPKYFTHMQPAIDADGVLIKVGDTVWHHSGFAHGVVTSIDAGSLMGTVRYVNGRVEFRDAAKDLTHARPDSWERLEEDAVKGVCEYTGAEPSEFGTHDCDTCRFYDERDKLICEQLMARDIVRRAKKLAGVER